jgi:FtsP/CotA-like multicopper oxidase with cupredoxin domain
MTVSGSMPLRTLTWSRTAMPHRRPAWTMRRIARLIVAAALATAGVSAASAQDNPPAPDAATLTPPKPGEATSPTVPCLPPGQDLVLPPEISSSDGVLKGDITLAEEFQRLPPTAVGNTSCPQQLMRGYRPGQPPPAPNELLNPLPGPTLRARVGELVQLTFFNAVDANRFDQNVVIGPNGCMKVSGKGGTEIYPATDVFPNCLHASSTANIHYHGTHTNPDATGDNVFLQILPLPRVSGKLTTTPAEATVGLEQFFKDCAAKLKDNPLNEWPTRWSDMPNDWIQEQKKLLKAYQDKDPEQNILTKDEELEKDGWPQYYIGAVPYCFALPHKPEDQPVDKGELRMGQAPGTQWYHAHKHGSTAIDVMNGMTGAFIIEGKYDDDLNNFYGSYSVKRGADYKPERWTTRNQPVLVLNQLGTTPNLLVGGAGPAGKAGVPFAVDGLVNPKAHMQPGEVQLWRIVNSSSRNAAYFMAPEGIQWRQVAQDGVQFSRETYASPQNQNSPFYMAPANRVDLLVQAPMTPGNFNVRIQAVRARSEVAPTPDKPNGADPVPGTVLMTVDVSGDSVTQNGEPVRTPMPFPSRGKAPDQPKFLTDITNEEWGESNYAKKEFTFDSKPPLSPQQHTINGHQFEDSKGKANVSVPLGSVEEWTIKNTTNTSTGPGVIDHPFHIHINPFQITEVFDPNESLVNPETDTLLAQLEGTDNNGNIAKDCEYFHKVNEEDKNKVCVADCEGYLKNHEGGKCGTIPVPRYVTDENIVKDTDNPFRTRQCFLNPANENTWSVAGACGPQPPRSNLIWWDTFAIPSGRPEKVGQVTKVIPGYFEMRSRFVDYPGVYVMHCHILIHEDRGMMFTMEVVPERRLMVHHH